MSNEIDTFIANLLVIYEEVITDIETVCLEIGTTEYETRMEPRKKQAKKLDKIIEQIEGIEADCEQYFGELGEDLPSRCSELIEKFRMTSASLVDIIDTILLYLKEW